MLVTPFSIVTLISEEQSENASSPMLVTLSGIIMLISEEQSLNAESPMLVTLPSVGIILLLHPKTKVFVSLSIKQFPIDTYLGLFESTAIFSSLVQL